MKLSVGPKKGVWNHKTQFEICEAFKIPLKSLLGQIYYWTSSWRLKRILLGPISYKAATPGPPPARAAVPPLPPPWAASAMRRRPDPDAGRAKQVPLPPPCRRRHRRRHPRMRPRAPLGMSATCRRHVGDMKKSLQFWADMPILADTRHTRHVLLSTFLCRGTFVHRYVPPSPHAT